MENLLWYYLPQETLTFLSTAFQLLISLTFSSSLRNGTILVCWHVTATRNSMQIYYLLPWHHHQNSYTLHLDQDR